MDDKYEFKRKLILNLDSFKLHEYLDLIGRLIQCMKGSNLANGKSNEYFTLIFREADPILDNSGFSPHVLEMKWGDKHF